MPLSVQRKANKDKRPEASHQGKNRHFGTRFVLSAPPRRHRAVRRGDCEVESASTKITATMLNAMRKHAYSWGIRILLGLITVVFVFWGIGSGLFNQVHPVAKVDGENILGDDLQRQTDIMRRSFQNMYGPQATDLLKHFNLQEQALEQLINQQLVEREARRLGVGVSNEELRSAIAAERAFQVGGQFDMETYEAVLRENSFTPAEYEDLRRNELTMKLLRDMVTQAVVLSDAQARQAYDQSHAQVAVAYLEVLSSDFFPQIHPTDQQVQQFYKENGETFREPERVKADYILYDPIKLGEKVNPTDKEIADFYKSNLKSLFSYPDRVRARHILIGVAPNASDKDRAAAKAKAEKILEQLKKGADFAKLAAQYSDDPGSRERGGDLGFFERGQMIKPFEDAAFALKPGQLSGVVETRFGYHIIQVEEAKPAHTDTLVQAKLRIIELLRERAGERAARADQREDLAAALNGAKLKDLAAKRGLELVTTPMFAQGEPIPRLERNPDFVTTVFKLGKGEVATVSGKESGLFLVQLVDRSPSHIPPLKEIEERVREALIRRDAENKARDRADSLLKQIKNAADFNRIAEINHLTVHKTVPFDRSSNTVPTIGDFQEVTQAVGDITPVPGVIARVMVQTGNYYIVELLSRQPPSDADWKKDAPAFKEQQLEAMRSQAWDNFLAGLKRTATIWVDPNAIGATPTESSM
jgi:peptidyl-prolyl cis-trans isomerase D